MDGARLCDQILAELGVLWDTEDEAELSLEQASAFTGYSTDHLRRLARLNRVPAARRGRRIFFRAADLPKKPRKVDDGGFSSYDPIADARQVTVWRHGGADDAEQTVA